MSNQRPQPLARNEYGAKRDAALQTARRIDWRFLLPNPRLGRVAYIGPPGGTLLTALGQFSASLTCIAPSDQTGPLQRHPSGFELVVLRSRKIAAVEKAHTLLRAGGYLYWEVERLRGLAPIYRITEQAGWKECCSWRSVESYLISLERLGFCNIEVHWHRPSFENCLEMIPLHEESALRYLFTQKRQGFAAQTLLAAGHLLLKTGWLQRLVPCLSIVACKRLASVAMV